MKCLSALVITIFGAACAHKPELPASAPPATPQQQPEPTAASAPPATRGTEVPLFTGIGTHTRRVLASPEAQRYFDQGLAFLFAFNHDEAIRSFKRAAELDPRCAMAPWGVAVASGPHINNPSVDPARAQAAWLAVTQARSLAASAKPVDQALIAAQAVRFADPSDPDPQHHDRHVLDRAYADAMRGVWEKFPEDADVGALYAESLMDLRPWDLWTQDGKPQPGTETVVATLDRVLILDPAHPLGNHLYIHAVEASPHPERADAAADRLRDLEPALGHMVHMPSHIDVLRGRWEQAVIANVKAIEADRAYRQRSPKQDFYRFYMAHNGMMLAYAATMRGQSALALQAIGDVADAMPGDWVRTNAALVDGFTALPLEIQMRFGRWDEILQAAEPPEYLPLARALRLYARGVAYAAKGDVTHARREQTAFILARDKVSKDARLGNSRASDVLDTAENTLAGEILVAENKPEPALDALRRAVAAEDRLRYDEPPDWIQPTRHALGAALLRFGKKSEAEAVYTEDLRRRPENGWSLFGLTRALRLQRKEAQAKEVEARFQNVWKDADFQLTSSCSCIPNV